MTNIWHHDLRLTTIQQFTASILRSRVRSTQEPSLFFSRSILYLLAFIILAKDLIYPEAIYFKLREGIGRIYFYTITIVYFSRDIILNCVYWKEVYAAFCIEDNRLFVWTAFNVVLAPMC